MKAYWNKYKDTAFLSGCFLGMAILGSYNLFNTINWLYELLMISAAASGAGIVLSLWNKHMQADIEDNIKIRDSIAKVGHAGFIAGIDTVMQAMGGKMISDKDGHYVYDVLGGTIKVGLCDEPHNSGATKH